ncbi:hypothetical protein LB503_008289 [Fusarium chuoi]|nr:hypothetical protein LB503_008289 [Fusarium chuoi]
MARIHCANAQSTANSFIQLARRSYTTTPQTPTPLEFLIPRCTPTCRLRTPHITVAQSRTYSHPIRSWDFKPRETATRQFSTTAIREKTRAILNPQQDEDGNEMMLEITERAAKRLNKIMEKDANPNLALRIQVESGGCHGFQYLMSLVTLPAKDAAEWSSIVSEDDTIFQYIPDDADPATTSEEGPKIILDEPSLDLLKGSKVDFTMELIGSQFKIIDNPLATSSCGCGTSFDIKM